MEDVIDRGDEAEVARLEELALLLQSHANQREAQLVAFDDYAATRQGEAQGSALSALGEQLEEAEGDVAEMEAEVGRLVEASATSQDREEEASVALGLEEAAQANRVNKLEQLEREAEARAKQAAVAQQRADAFNAAYNEAYEWTQAPPTSTLTLTLTLTHRRSLTATTPGPLRW